MTLALRQTDVVLDDKGRPVVNGYFYVGTYGTDPVSNPLTLYSDVDLTTPIANPQRTDSYGRPENDIYLGTNAYSYLIKNSAETTIEGPKDRTDALDENIVVRFANSAALRAFSSPVQQTAFVDGADGGLFRRDSSDTSSAEDGGSYSGTIIRGADYATRGVWKRVFSDGYDIKWYGAVGGADSNTAINNAINAATAAGGADVAVTPAASAYIFTAIVIKDNVTLRGLGGELKFADNTATNPATSYYPISNISGASTFYTDSAAVDLIIDGNKANNTSFTVCDAITIGGVRGKVIGCRVINPPDAGVMFSEVTNGTVDDLYVEGSTDTALYFNDTAGAATTIGNTINNVRAKDCFQVLGIKRALNKAIISNIFGDDCGNGITIEDFSAAGGDHPNELLISNVLLNRTGYSWASASKVGLTAQACRNLQVTGFVSLDTEGTALELQGCIDSQFRGIEVYCTATQLSASPVIKLLARSTAGLSQGNSGVLLDAVIVRGAQGRGLYLQNQGSILNRGITLNDLDIESESSDAMRVDNLFREIYGRNWKLHAKAASGVFDLSWNIANTVRVHGEVKDVELKSRRRNGSPDILNDIAYASTGRGARYSVASATPQAATTTGAKGSHIAGSVADNHSPSAGQPIGWVCTVSGTSGTLTAITGSVSSGSRSLTVSNSDDIYPGDSISIAGVSGTKVVLDIDRDTDVVTIDVAADATVSGAAVQFVTGTWVAKANL